MNISLRLHLYTLKRRELPVTVGLMSLSASTHSLSWRQACLRTLKQLMVSRRQSRHTCTCSLIMWWRRWRAGWQLAELREQVIDDRWVKTKPSWAAYRDVPISFACVWRRRRVQRVVNGLAILRPFSGHFPLLSQ